MPKWVDLLAYARRPALGVLVLLFLSYAYFVQGAGANQNSRFDLTRAIVEEGTLSIDAYHQNTFDKALSQGRYYSDKAPGLSLLAVPGYWLSQGLGLATQRPGVVEPDAASLHLAGLFSVGIASAAAGALLCGLLLRLGLGTWSAAGTSLLWGLGSNAFGYAGLFVGHQLAAAGLTAGVYLALASTQGWVHKRRHLLMGLSLGVATLSEYPAVIGAAAIVAFTLWREGLRCALPIGLGALGPALCLFGYNALCFGHPFSLGYSHLENPDFQRAISRGFFGLGTPELSVLSEVLVGQYRGLLPLSPFFLLVVPGIWQMRQEPKSRALLALCSSIVGAYLLFVSSYTLWHGGAAMGPRYLVVALPFLVIPCAFALDAIGRLRQRVLRLTCGVIAGLFGVASVGMCTLTVAVMPELPDVATLPSPDGTRRLDMRRPLTELVLPLALVEDRVSEKATRGGRIGVVYRSGEQHHWDAYNLGERWGLEGSASLLPLLALWLSFGFATLRLWSEPTRD